MYLLPSVEIRGLVFDYLPGLAHKMMYITLGMTLNYDMPFKPEALHRMEGATHDIDEPSTAANAAK